jgi:hypothetical protein
MANDINIVVSAQVGDATRGLQQVQKQVQQVDRQIKQSTSVLRKNANQFNSTSVATNKFAKGALQQAGYQVGDFAVQLSGGQNALQAFGQQGSQMLGIFGPIGAVLGAAVAIFAALGVAVQRSGAEVSDMAKALGVLEEPLTAVASSVAAFKGSLGSGFTAILQNIDTALIAAGLFAGFMATKYLKSILFASGATMNFATILDILRVRQALAAMEGRKLSVAMVALQTATLYATAALKAMAAVFMRLLPIAILLGLAKAVEMFLQLRKGAGSFAEALVLLREVARESFSRMMMRGERMFGALNAGVQRFKLNFINALIPVAENFDKFASGLTEKWNNMFPEEGLLAPLRMTVARGFADELDQASSDISANIATIEARMAAIDEALKAPNASLESLRAAFASGATDINIFGAGVDEAARGGAESIKKNLIPAFEQAKAVQDAVSSSVESGLMAMVDGTKSVKDAFRSMASEIIKELYRIFVVKKITGMIGAFAGDVTSMAQGNFFSGIPGAPARAMGGQVTGGRPYMVGERGPEMIVPQRNGNVVPNNQLGGGGVTVNQTINVSTGVQQTVRAEIKTLMPQIAEASKAAVADAVRRGGSYGRAFA